MIKRGNVWMRQFAAAAAGILMAEAASLPAFALDRTVTSPDKKIAITVGDGGGLHYTVTMDGKPVVQRSDLGVDLEGGKALGPSATLKGEAAIRNNDGTWQDPFGKRRIVPDRYQEMRLNVEQVGVAFALTVRAYDDGVALRYHFPRQEALGTFVITAERTSFLFAEDRRGWLGEPSTSAESRYLEHKLSQLPTTGRPRVVPLLAEIPQGYALVAESDLRDWAGMFLTGVEGKAGAKVSLCPRRDRRGAVVVDQTRQSPWRVIVLARAAGDLAATDIIKTLASPSQIEDASWLKPGITAWDEWWARGVNTRGDTATHKRYIDLAARMGWPYQLVDWGWTKNGDTTQYNDKVNIPELLAYAKDRGVRLILWMHSNELNRTGIDRSLANAAAWGAAGVKVDFMDSDSQETVQWYEEVLGTAAKHKLFVNFHGAYKPTGLARTWPNYLTQEGVLGNEYNKLPGKKITPAHTLMLVFTRGVLGPMDFTPGGFVNVSSDAFQQDAGARGGNCQVIGTRARQLAMTVIYESPLLCLCDSPESYLGPTRDKPQPGLSFFTGLPTVWDETQVLAAEIGSHVVIARRAGEKWYIGALNADAAATIRVSLRFLGTGRWTLTSYADTPESATKPTALAENTHDLNPADPLTLHLAAGGGGFAGVLSPKP